MLAGSRATFGAGALGAGLRRLRQDRALDVAFTGAVLAAAIVALLLVVVVAKLAMTLVASVQRKDTGALLLGVSVVIAVPFVALLGLPIFRVTRRAASIVPALGALPRVAVLAVGGLLAIAGLGLFVVFTRLDWRVLGLGAYGLIAVLVLGTPLLLALGHGPLDGVRRKLPGRGVLVAVGALIALALPVLTLGGAPSRQVATAVIDESLAGAKLVAAYRGVLDGDGDGYSAFFGGPDCDDGRASVNPGAKEIAGNGIDDNCRGGDRAADAGEDGSGDGTASGTAVASGTGTGTGAGAGTAATPPAPTALAGGANVLVIMIDTVRADRLGVAGYQRDGVSLTPRLDAFAQQSTWFTRAYSQASNTPRAMPAFMTSRYPSVVAVDKLNKNYPVLADDNLMLFEVLKEAGLKTIGFSSHFYFRDERNFQQGFDEYDNEGALDIGPANKDIAAPRIVPKVLARLDALAASKERFAMWVHLFEPHSSYVEHGVRPITERGTASLIQKYDYELAFTDGWTGQIFDKLAERGLDQNTIVVVVSDHGEAFGVHRFAGEAMFFHGQTLYDELLRIPLLVRVPGQAAQRSDAVVQLIDVAPTLLDALGIALPASFMGRSLAPALRGEPLAERPAFAELIPYPSWKHEGKAAISGDGAWKLFDRISDGKQELYDLRVDAEERTDLWSKDKAAAARMQALLLDFVEVTLAGASE